MGNRKKSVAFLRARPTLSDIYGLKIKHVMYKKKNLRDNKGKVRNSNG